MPLTHFSRIGRYGNRTPDLLHGRPEYEPIHHQPIVLVFPALKAQETPCIGISCSDNTVILSNGTSMISLIIPPKDQIARVSKLLAEEYGTAANIKSRVNRYYFLSHQSPDTS